MAGIYQGQWTGQEIDAAIGRTAHMDNTNLLDNAYFVGGGGNGKFPINQRGQSSYTGAAYTIDRWTMLNGSGSVALTTTGLVFSNSSGGYGYWVQKWSEEQSSIPSGATLTFSVIANGVLYTSTSSVTLPSGLLVYRESSYKLAIRIPANLAQSETISAIKLEIGTQQTLAHRDGTSYVVNNVPNYQQELAKCQRYLYIPTIPSGSQLAIWGFNASSSSASAVNAICNLPVPMRATPTASGTVHSIRGGGTVVTSSLAIGTPSYITGANVIVLPISTGGSFGAYTAHWCVLITSLVLSAEP